MPKRKKIYAVINEKNKSTKLSKAFDLFIMALIVLNVIAIILESFQELKIQYKEPFRIFENVSVLIFTFEYFLRIITSKEKYPELSTFRAMLKYITSPLAIIDLLAILPTFLPLFFTVDLRFIRILRLLRIARLFKLNRYSNSLKLILDVFNEKKSELSITVFLTFILLTFSSTLMYYLENAVQPEAFPNILASFWWAVATLTTVGYGDVYPITGWGKFVSGIIALLGIGLVALPTGILSAAFIEKVGEQKASNKNTCPTCGQPTKN